MAGFKSVRLALLALGLVASSAASAQVVISQAYGGGGNSGATYTHDFVELFNRGESAVSLNGWTVQYASATGTTWSVSAALPNVQLQPGRYYLVRLASGANGVALPGFDHDGGGTVNLSGTNGKVALANTSTQLTGSCPLGGAVVDFVGYGSANCFEGTAAVAVLANATSAQRVSNGCQDTNVNSADFVVATAAARWSSTAANLCFTPLPVVSFDAAAVSADEGGDGDANPLNFIVNVAPAPQPGSPVSFDIGVSGEAGRFSYAGPASLTVTDSTTLPITITVNTVGNTAVQGDSPVTVSLSGFSGTAGSQADPISKQGMILEDDQPTLPIVSFAEGALSVAEGSTGDANPLNFLVNVAPAPTAGNPISFDIAASGPAGRFTYAGPASLTVTDTTPLPITLTVTSIGNRDDDPDAVVTLSLSGFSGTDAAQPSPVEKSGTILDDDLPISEIFEIQGSGVCSPFVTPCNIGANVTGVGVRAAANVVIAIGPSGFFMQTPNARDDNNLATSNGIYVFTAAAPRTDGAELLAVGDEVEVVGRAAEFFGLTQVVVNSTRDGANSVLRSASGRPLPSAIIFGSSPTRGVTQSIPSRDPGNLSCGATGNFECFEGMRVSMPDGAVSVSNQRFSTDLYAEVYVSPYGERGLREKGARFGNSLIPANLGAGIWDGNPEIIEMDADTLLPANAGLELAGGTRFSAEGVIGFDFGDYEFWPTTLSIVPGTNEVVRPVPVSSSNELTIGSFNVFRLCDAIAGNTISLCSSSAGAETDANRVAHQLGQISAYVRSVLRSPDVIGMQEVENLAVLQLLATQIANDGGPAYVAYLIEGNDVGGIDVGFLVNPARVANAVVTQLAGSETWNDPQGTSTSILHDRPPLLLAAEFIGNGHPFRFHVLNNHTRSRGGVDVSDASGERIRAKRFTQASSIATLLQGLQTAPETAQVPLLMIGDLNAYQFTDAYVDVVGLMAGAYVDGENTCSPSNAVTNCKLPGGANIVVPAMVNAVDVIPLAQRYSYKFTENFGAIQGSAGRDVATNQVLDHALFNHVAAPFVTGMAYGRANVDSSGQRFRVCNYTLRDQALCPQGPGTWVPTGSSDHDGLVIFLTPPLPDAIFANGFED